MWFPLLWRQKHSTPPSTGIILYDSVWSCRALLLWDWVRQAVVSVAVARIQIPFPGQFGNFESCEIVYRWFTQLINKGKKIKCQQPLVWWERTISALLALNLFRTKYVRTPLQTCVEYVVSTPWSEHRRGVSSEIGSPSAPCSQLDNSDASHAMEYEAQSTSYRVQSVCLPFFFFLFLSHDSAGRLCSSRLGWLNQGKSTGLG